MGARRKGYMVGFNSESQVSFLKPGGGYISVPYRSLSEVFCVLKIA